MFIRDQLESEKIENAQAPMSDGALRKLALDFIIQSDKFNYAYQWTWLGLPILQLPQDIVLTQEIIWTKRPDVIIETGIAWGGSVLLYASLLQLLGKGKVVAVDLNLMDHVAAQILGYPFSDRIHLLKGSSTDPGIVAGIKSKIAPGQSVMVILDSNHTHDHVLRELELYAPMVTKGQFLIVADTIIEKLPTNVHRQRPWGPGNNPKTALTRYLEKSGRFVIDADVNAKPLMSFSPDAYCRCIKD